MYSLETFIKFKIRGMINVSYSNYTAHHRNSEAVIFQGPNK